MQVHSDSVVLWLVSVRRELGQPLGNEGIVLTKLITKEINSLMSFKGGI
jgi:hypothetical protein